MSSIYLAALITIIMPAEPTCAGLRAIAQQIKDNPSVEIIHTTNKGELWKLELDWQRAVFGKEDLPDNIYSICVTKELIKKRDKEWM